MVPGVGGKRSVLFLQGLATPFFVRLGREIANRGHEVYRINFCGGDRVFWPRMGATDFRGRFCDWRSFLISFLDRTAVTDIVLFGDCRPYHRVAVDVARSLGVAVHVFEEGYFRPNWVTLEKDGTNAFSSLPREAGAILAEAAQDGVDHDVVHVGGGFSRRIRWELLNQITTLASSPLYPHYRRHRSEHPLRELTGWLKRVSKRPLERGYTDRVSEYLKSADRTFYLLPLQLETDFQIRRHSKFKSMTDLMRLVLESFARKAPADSILLIKLHPLDNGLVNFRRRAERMAKRFDLVGRVMVIDGGHLPTLLSTCRGVVLVNSTTGLSAIHHNRPLKVLGNAVFDLPGLTFQGSLDRFWQEGVAPNQELFRAFRRVVLRRAQVNGSFFTDEGIALAVDGALERLGVPTLPVQAPSWSRGEVDSSGLAAAKSAVLAR
jgi:capsular polysaccharide export protein